MAYETSTYRGEGISSGISNLIPELVAISDIGYAPAMTDHRRLMRVRRLAETGAARAIRQSAGLSLTELGEAAGVDRTSVWRWETGRRRPRGAAALRYLEVLEEIGA